MIYKRARTSKGRYRGDNKTTLFNEAWVMGSSPNFIKKSWKKFVKWFWKDYYK